MDGSDKWTDQQMNPCKKKEKNRCPLTSGGRQREDELLGVPDVERCDRKQAAGLPHLHLVRETNQIEPVDWTQVIQDAEQGVLSLEGGRVGAWGGEKRGGREWKSKLSSFFSSLKVSVASIDGLCLPIMESDCLL